jgi:hypothetical protein
MEKRRGIPSAVLVASTVDSWDILHVVQIPIIDHLVWLLYNGAGFEAIINHLVRMLL